MLAVGGSRRLNPTPDMNTQISVIIPTINEAPWIERAVSRAWEAKVDEVLVIDGGSEDETVALAQKCGATVLQGPPGRAVQQNQGAQHASGEILLFLHADNWLAPTVGQQIRECLCRPEVLGGAFRQRIEAPGLPYRLLEWGNIARVCWRGLPYGDQSIFMYKKTFEQLGQFPQVKLMEDLLLMRAFRHLASPVLLPGPVYVHPRRWQQHGIVRQTIRNWLLLSAQALGVSPNRLAQFYPLHDRTKKSK